MALLGYGVFGICVPRKYKENDEYEAELIWEQLLRDIWNWLWQIRFLLQKRNTINIRNGGIVLSFFYITLNQIVMDCTFGLGHAQCLIYQSNVTIIDLYKNHTITSQGMADSNLSLPKVYIGLGVRVFLQIPPIFPLLVTSYLEF
jgi:hypothetical protein